MQCEYNASQRIANKFDIRKVLDNKFDIRKVLDLFSLNTL